jgi:hypothetical protein
MCVFTSVFNTSPSGWKASDQGKQKKKALIPLQLGSYMCDELSMLKHLEKKYPFFLKGEKHSLDAHRAWFGLIAGVPNYKLTQTRDCNLVM